MAKKSLNDEEQTEAAVSAVLRPSPDKRRKNIDKLLGE